jgi:hypothetical protein
MAEGKGPSHGDQRAAGFRCDLATGTGAATRRRGCPLAPAARRSTEERFGVHSHGGPWERGKAPVSGASGLTFPDAVYTLLTTGRGVVARSSSFVCYARIEFFRVCIYVIGGNQDGPSVV